MRTHLPNWLRGVMHADLVSKPGVVSPLVPEVVSGVSRGSSRVVGSLALAGLSLVVTSCAEPKLDGLPEDPGNQLPLPTIGPPAATDIGGDGAVGETADASLTGPVSEDTTTDDHGKQDASVDVTDDVSPTTGTSGTATPSTSSTATSTTTSAPTGTGSTGASTSEADGSESDTTDTTNTGATETEEPTDDTDTSAAQADAGWPDYYDAGDTSDTSDTSDATSADVDAGDAGDGGVDGGVEP